MQRARPGIKVWFRGKGDRETHPSERAQSVLDLYRAAT